MLQTKCACNGNCISDLNQITAHNGNISLHRSSKDHADGVQPAKTRLCSWLLHALGWTPTSSWCPVNMLEHTIEAEVF